MSNVPRWFERKFEVSFPLELLPNLRSRLRGAPARLEESVRETPRTMLIKKPTAQWSAQEHCGHLLDLEPLWLTRVHDFVNGSTELTPTDLLNRKTNEASYNDQPLEDILSAFRAARAALLQYVEALPSDSFAGVIPHPRLKTPMSLADHLYFVAEHDDHHLARIWELISVP